MHISILFELKHYMIDVCIILYTCDYDYIIYIHDFVCTVCTPALLFPSRSLETNHINLWGPCLAWVKLPRPHLFQVPSKKPSTLKMSNLKFGVAYAYVFFWCQHCNWVFVKKCFLLSVLSSFLAGAPWCWRGVPVASLPSVPENDSLSPQILWHSILGEG